jgi:hypothetical protein
MLNVERRQREGLGVSAPHSTLNIRQSTFNLVVFITFLLLASPLTADDLQVDKRTLSPDDTLTITITLADSFASLDAIQLPLQNLVLDGSPSVSSEFSWTNGSSSRRKVFRFVAHPRGPGPALIGPLVLRAEGRVETLAPVLIQVLPDRTAGTNDPVRILHEMLATGRDPIFVVAEAGRTSVYAGEQVVVTWTIYNASNVQHHGITENPKLADFWTEELEVRGEVPQQIVVGGMVMQRLVIRRVALFPLRSGTLTVEPLSIGAQIMKRIDVGNPFGLFEGSVVDVTRRSSPLVIEARPIPPGPPVAAVGDLSLICGTPSQKNGGPVSFAAELRGTGNLRAAPAPTFARDVAGSLQMEEVSVAVQRQGRAVMARRWRYLMFPTNAGMFVIPPLKTTILTPDGERRELRCEQRALVVEAVDATTAPAQPAMTPSGAGVEEARRLLPLAGIVAAILVAIAVLWPRFAKASRVRAQVRALVRDTPAEVRVAADEWLSSRGFDPAVLLKETSERGDAYRALRSLTDAAERERLVADPTDLRVRIRDLVNSL